MEFVLLAVVLLALARGQGGGSPAINPVQYTQSPNAMIGGSINMGGALSVPILSSALNGFARPGAPAFSVGANVGLAMDPATVAGWEGYQLQSDPQWGNPGAGMWDFNTYETAPGINPGSPLQEMVTSYDQLGI